ncbi:MAG: MBL fold metallo-hydrolase [Eubacteriales bacterium]|nr:MBL fold metallo-hydrolase [Eubacteriales bacterium]
MITYDYKVIGLIATNCYLIKNEDTKQSVLIDPAEAPQRLQEMIDKSGCELKAVLLTHGHSDHISAAKEVCEKNHVRLYAGEDEKELLQNPQLNLSSQLGAAISIEADCWVKDNDQLNIAGMDIKAIHTPGHTAGGMCYYIEEAGLLFSGDTLFAESVGKTDFPTGSMSELVRSVKEKLMILPDDTRVLPGHGEDTSIGYEKKYNPYCQ